MTIALQIGHIMIWTKVIIVSLFIFNHKRAHDNVVHTFCKTYNYRVIYIYTYVYKYIYIYIDIEREREREREMNNIS